MGSVKVEIVRFDDSDRGYKGCREWAGELLRQAWGSTLVVSRGRLHDALDLPGFVAMIDDLPQGLATYRLEGSECELVTINSQRTSIGVGSALVKAVREAADKAACRRLWLITTNDNTDALRFYQMMGFSLVALHRNAVELSRQLKPEIPEVGLNGIPLRDELELEMRLEKGADPITHPK